MKKVGYYFTIQPEIKEGMEYCSNNLNTTNARYINAAINYFNEMYDKIGIISMLEFFKNIK